MLERLLRSHQATLTWRSPTVCTTGIESIGTETASTTAKTQESTLGQLAAKRFGNNLQAAAQRVLTDLRRGCFWLHDSRGTARKARTNFLDEKSERPECLLWREARVPERRRMSCWLMIPNQGLKLGVVRTDFEVISNSDYDRSNLLLGHVARSTLLFAASENPKQDKRSGGTKNRKGGSL